ncbi:HPr family phosphocarrier protein [Alkaliphilus transvaalensis]|uniref:HPr family phosphocarrier protein n=1 Tax=Alkaliphilus transvaalensis TaxID=114628 RepID=UPI000478A980|nr:HPr family phosphocarrier protein [Alkaliphilus transvaalensis]
MKKEITILNETGIHARPAAIISKTAGEFSSEIFIEFKDKVVNAKSIMNILSAGLQKGDKAMLTITGEDEAEAMMALEELFNSSFGE